MKVVNEVLNQSLLPESFRLCIIYEIQYKQAYALPIVPKYIPLDVIEILAAYPYFKQKHVADFSVLLIWRGGFFFFFDHKEGEYPEIKNKS